MVCMWLNSAFLLLPNVFMHEAFGKLLFVACDLLAGNVLFQILRLRGLPEKSERLNLIYHTCAIRIIYSGY